MRPYAIYTGDQLHYLGLHEDEAACWKVALGWPSEQEVATFKNDRSATCCAVQVRPITATDANTLFRKELRKPGGLMDGPFI